MSFPGIVLDENGAPDAGKAHLKKAFGHLANFCIFAVVIKAL